MDFLNFYVQNCVIYKSVLNVSVVNSFINFQYVHSHPKQSIFSSIYFVKHSIECSFVNYYITRYCSNEVDYISWTNHSVERVRYK